MDFVVGDLVRQGFGFENPNHAAAAICALFPFCWGWRGRWRWAGWLVGVLLCVMLAMTYSWTGMAVLAIEAAMLWRGRKILLPGMVGHAETCRTSTRSARSTWLKKMQGRGGLVTSSAVAVAVAAIALWWMWPRLVLDGAILNRPKIWLAGLQLAAANPLGVGLGKSGALASAFLLPESITVRTLVNSHLTLLAEMGALVGGLWFAFLAAAIASGRDLPRTRIAFAGLAVSACSASVFDWHVLFGLGGAPDFGSLNLALSWLLFSAFVTMGFVLIVRGFAWRRVGIAAAAAVAAMLVAVACGRSGKDSASLVVADGFVAWGNGPWVYHDAEWSLKVLKERFPKGARIRIKDGVDDIETTGPDVWLFGEVAESAERFGDRKVTVVAPPDYYEPPANVAEVRSL